MKLPALRGLIRRRLLVNWRVDPEVMQRLLPAPFRPKLHAGHAIAGVCLIRLEEIRPRLVPACVGLASENAAHRVAVLWDEDGVTREGVYIPRRDTGSLANRLAGGRLFPGEHHGARFTVTDEGGAVDLDLRSDDGLVAVRVRGRDAQALPPGSCFGSLAEASAFFAGGAQGFSVRREAGRLDGIELRTEGFRVGALEVEHASSTWFEDEARFPRGSATFDCALVMRDLPHEWRAVPEPKACAACA